MTWKFAYYSLMVLIGVGGWTFFAVSAYRLVRTARRIRAQQQQEADEKAEAELWDKRRKEAAEDAKLGGYTLCDRCKLRRVENYPGSTMCPWCGI